MFSPLIGVVLFALALKTAQPAEKNNFSCEGRPSGYYADVRSGCQIYHMCDGLGRQFSYSCPNTTLFQQRMLICDHWYMVNCSRSENDYEANLLIGQNKPFVEDSNKHPYHRTPRPDLLSQPTAAEYDIVYRTVRTKHQDNSNVVGADSDQNNSSYNLPSHWSTEYSKENATRRPARVEPPIDASNRNKTPKAIDFNANLNNLNPANKYSPPVNFKSLFKNTTPVFPTREQLTTPSTTGEEEVLQQPAIAKSPIGDLPLEVRPPLFENFNRNDTTFGSTAPPSKFYEPPNFAPNFYKDSATEENRYSASEAKNAKKVKVNARQSNEKILKDLRKMFSIPDYEFPLDNNNASRPSYNDGPSSFQVNPFLSNFTQRQHS